MKGVILAAGKGSRLYPVTHHIPKPLLPLANRATLEYAFDRLVEIGVKDICLVVGENAEAMRSALGDGRGVGVRLSYALQDEPNGLAHAMACARDFVEGDEFVMYLGDAIYSEPLTDAAQRFSESGCANLDLVMPVEDPSRFGVANVDGGRIVKLVEKPVTPESNLAMAGVYFFRAPIWDMLAELKPSVRGEYEITDAIQMLIERGYEVLPCVYQGSWFDTGTLDSFLACSSLLLNGGTLIGSGASVVADVGSSVCIGEGAIVDCAEIEDSVILPGASVHCQGRIVHSILGGGVESFGDLQNEIAYG
ncbi:MAG: NTP transferase domain-containing protein [Armatimonadetes bacterium]|nr:NTP transferase domain-containing protein [Armatimonadota bacterium]